MKNHMLWRCFSVFLLISCLFLLFNACQTPEQSTESRSEDESSTEEETISLRESFAALPQYTGTHDLTLPHEENHVPPRSAITVVIDAGHGQRDPGVMAGDIRESDINLKLSVRLGALLERMGYRVLMIREDDTALLGDNPNYNTDKEAEARRNFALNADADIYISIHCNSDSSDAARGTRIFFHQHAAVRFEGRKIANLYQTALNDEFASEIEEGKVTTVKDKYLNGLPEPYIVLKDKNMPAFLFEIGFLTNDADRQNLTTDDYLWEYAHALALGTESARIAALVGKSK